MRGLIGTLAFLYLLGTTGSLELDKITCTQFLIRVAVTFVVLIIVLWKEGKHEAR